jgi:hypothetical protein
MAMNMVLFAAVASLFLAIAAQAADAHSSAEAAAAPQRSGASYPAAVSQAPIPHHVAPVSASGALCIEGASITATSYDPDADAESNTSPCSQYLSTQTLVQSPTTGRT